MPKRRHDSFEYLNAARSGGSSPVPSSVLIRATSNKMKLTLVLAVSLAVVALVASAPQGSQTPVPIVSNEFDMKEDGSYSFSYETGDGIKRSETGAQKKIGEETGSTSQGTISWKTPDGKTVTLTFTADENGYQPKVTIS